MAQKKAYANVGDILNQGLLVGTAGASGAVKHYMCEIRVQSKDRNPLIFPNMEKVMSGGFENTGGKTAILKCSVEEN